MGNSDSLQRRMPGWLRREAGHGQEERLQGAGAFQLPGQLWVPPTDVVEYAKEVVIRLEVPGIDTEDLTIVQDGSFLIVEGRRDRPHAEEETTVSYHVLEIPYGTFRRVFEFPAFLRLDEVEATYHCGFLTIRIPKARKAQQSPVSVRLKIQTPPIEEQS